VQSITDDETKNEQKNEKNKKTPTGIVTTLPYKNEKYKKKLTGIDTSLPYKNHSNRYRYDFTINLEL